MIFNVVSNKRLVFDLKRIKNTTGRFFLDRNKNLHYICKKINLINKLFKMKKALLFVAVATFVSGTMVSCGKSSKGKMDGEWKVDSMTQTSTSTSGGSTSTDKMTISGTTVTQSSTSGGTTTTATGVLNSATWNIKKDGTWDREMSVTFSGTGYSTTTKMVSSGNWDFATGVGEFKKNERVVFSTLSETTTSTNTFGGSTTTSTSTDTYLDGENSEIYTIVESKKKSLNMEYKKSNSSSGSGSTTYTETEDMTVTLSLQ